MSDTYDPDTRPVSNDPAVVAAWQQKRLERQQRIAAEQAFRDRAMQHFGESAIQWKTVSEDITQMRAEMREGMQAHEQRDTERFAAAEQRHQELAKKVGGHTLVISSSRQNWKLFYAVLGALVTILGVAATIWTLVKGG